MRSHSYQAPEANSRSWTEFCDLKDRPLIKVVSLLGYNAFGCWTFTTEMDGFCPMAISCYSPCFIDRSRCQTCLLALTGILLKSWYNQPRSYISVPQVVVALILRFILISDALSLVTSVSSNNFF